MSRSRRGRMQKQSKARVRRNLFVLVGMLALAIGLTFSLRENTPQGPVATASTSQSAVHDEVSSAIAQLRSTFAQYVQSRGYGEDMWLLDEYNPEKNWDLVFSVTDTLDRRIRHVVEKYRTVSPFADTLAAAFRTYISTVAFRGYSARLTRTEAGAKQFADVEPTGRTLEVCFIPRVEMPHYPSPLYYRHEWGSLMVALVDWPDALFPAMLFHELGHAYAHRVQHRASATAPPSSELYVSEEVEMHDLETCVLDAATHGGFAALLDEIVRRAATDAHPAAVLAGIQFGDIAKLEQLCGATGSGPTVLSALHAQFVYAVGVRYIDASLAWTNAEGLHPLFTQHRDPMWHRIQLYGFMRMALSS